jgi:hypothetical protein
LKRHFSREYANSANEIQIIKIQKIWSEAALIRDMELLSLRSVRVFAAKNGLPPDLDWERFLREKFRHKWYESPVKPRPEVRVTVFERHAHCPPGMSATA